MLNALVRSKCLLYHNFKLSYGKSTIETQLILYHKLINPVTRNYLFPDSVAGRMVG